MPTPRWELGTILYRKADATIAGMLTGYVVRFGGAVTYIVAWVEDGEDTHWEIELTDEKAL